MAEHLGRAPAISDRMPSWLLEALPRSTGGAKKTPATDLYCCKRLIIWKNIHYLKRGNRVESSLAILPIIVRLPLVPQPSSDVSGRNHILVTNVIYARPEALVLFITDKSMHGHLWDWQVYPRVHKRCC